MHAADADAGPSRTGAAVSHARPAGDEIDSNDSSFLVSAAQRGDRAALARLHQQYAPMVHGVLLARVPYHDANDLTQDVFMQAMQKLHTLHDASAIGPWLMTIARRAAADHVRRRRANVALSDDHPAPQLEGSPTDDSRRARAALDAIRSLPEAYHETLILRLVEGLTGPQIAARTGLSHGSVRVNLHRGMQMLRAALGVGGAES